MSKSLAPALTGGLNLIELISHKKEVGFNQLQDLSQLNVSTLNRLLKTLLEMSYLQKNTEGLYVLGPKLFMLTHYSSEWNVMLDQIHVILEEVSQKYKITSLFYAPSDGGFTVIDKVTSTYNVTMRGIGEKKADFIRSPWGFLYLSTLKEPEPTAYYNTYLDIDAKGVHVPTLEELYEHIEQCKKNGYGDDKGKIIDGVRRLAVPLMDQQNIMIGALGIGSFEHMLTEDKIAAIVFDLLAAKTTLHGY